MKQRTPSLYELGFSDGDDDGCGDAFVLLRGIVEDSVLLVDRGWSWCWRVNVQDGRMSLCANMLNQLN